MLCLAQNKPLASDNGTNRNGPLKPPVPMGKRHHLFSTAPTRCTPRRRNLPPRKPTPMSPNLLKALVSALAVGACVLGYFLYQETRDPTGVSITIGDDTLSIEEQ